MVNKKKLVELASLFPSDKTLYAVGGYVRDALLGIESHDVDVCSELTVDKVKTALLNSDFEVLDKNLRVGTVIIKSRGFNAEYTTFRTDSYPDGSGKHTPDDVTFTSDMRLDALRRDFGCNAIYFNPLTDEIVDVLGKRGEVENKIIATVDDPEKVFSADGHRILRLVRFACELGFEIEKNTLETAKKYAPLVKDIAVERVLSELDKILVADTVHPEFDLKDAHVRGVELLDYLGLLDMLLPELTALKGLAQPVRYHLYDAYVHSIECFRVSPPRLRWACLLHDVGKRPCMDRDGNMHAHAVVGAGMVADRLTALRMPKARVKRIKDLIFNHMVDINGNMKENKMTWFVAENFGLAPDLADLKDCDSIGAIGAPLEKNRVRETCEKIINEKLPVSIRDLPVDGKDLIEIGIEEKSRGIVLYDLWRETVMNPVLLDREKAIAYLEKRRGK